jgi:hypothetical protein
MKIIDTGGEELSYCAFGLDFNDDEGGPMLTKSNLHTFRDGVALAQMPKTFRDVCLLSAMLLTKYIWIDALCIDQSNHEETAREVRNMAEIYRSAVVTISPRSQLQPQSNQVKWGRYDILCRKQSLQPRLYSIQRCLSTMDSLESFASAVTMPVYSDIEPYIQSNVDALSCREVLLMFDAPKAQTSSKVQPLLEQSSKPEHDIHLTPIEEPLPQGEQKEDNSGELHAIAAAWLCIDEGIKDYAQNNKLRAVTRLVQARELIKTQRVASQDALRVDVQATTYLARIFLIDGSAGAAMDLLNNVKVSQELEDSQEDNSATM